jgi:hypothetical protein
MSYKVTQKNVEPNVDPRINKINKATAEIIQAYLVYAQEVVISALHKQGYGSDFKEIDDDLIIKPCELIDLINRVQNALVSAED